VPVLLLLQVVLKVRGGSGGAGAVAAAAGCGPCRCALDQFLTCVISHTAAVAAATSRKEVGKQGLGKAALCHSCTQDKGPFLAPSLCICDGQCCCKQKHTVFFLTAVHAAAAAVAAVAGLAWSLGVLGLGCSFGPSKQAGGQRARSGQGEAGARGLAVNISRCVCEVGWWWRVVTDPNIQVYHCVTPAQARQQSCNRCGCHFDSGIGPDESVVQQFYSDMTCGISMGVEKLSIRL